MKWGLIVFLGCFLGIQSQAENKALSPAATNDLRTVVAFAQKIEREHKGLPSDLSSGLYEIRKRCDKAGRAEYRLANFQERVDDLMMQKRQPATLRVVYTPPLQAFHYAQDKAMSEALQKSIHRKIAMLYKALPSQQFISDLLNPAVTQKLEPSSPLREIAEEASNVQLIQPEQLVANAKLFLQTLNRSVNGSFAGYIECKRTIDLIGGGQI